MLDEGEGIMVYAISDGLWATIVGAITALLVAVLNTWTRRTVIKKVDPLANQLATIQINTDGRLDELLALNRLQRDARETGVELTDLVKQRIIDAVGEPRVIALADQLKPTSDAPTVKDLTDVQPDERWRDEHGQR